MEQSVDQAAIARFEARGRHEDLTPRTQSPVIPHVTDKYEPDHPDADWAGVVRRADKKRFYTHHGAAKDSLTYDETGGLVPRDANPLRKTGKQRLQRQLTSLSNHESNGCSDWRSSYASQTAMEATAKDKFVFGSRQNTHHKRHVMPLYEHHRAAAPPQSLHELRQACPLLGQSGSSGSLSSRRSLLAGIGKLVAADELSGILPPPRHLSESYSNRGSKTLVAENHHGATVGYTGRRNIS